MILVAAVLIAVGWAAGAGGNAILRSTLRQARTDLDTTDDFTVSTRRRLAAAGALIGAGLALLVTGTVLALLQI